MKQNKIGIWRRGLCFLLVLTMLFNVSMVNTFAEETPDDSASETTELEPGKYIAELFRDSTPQTTSTPLYYNAKNDFCAQALLEVSDDNQMTLTIGVYNWSLYDSLIVLNQSYNAEYIYTEDYVPETWLDKFELYNEEKFRETYSDYVVQVDDSYFNWKLGENVDYDEKKDIAYVTIPIEDYTQPIYEMSWVHNALQGVNQLQFHEGSYLRLNLDSLINLNHLENMLKSSYTNGNEIEYLKLHSILYNGTGNIQFSTYSPVSSLFENCNAYVISYNDDNLKIKYYMNYNDGFVTNYSKPYLVAELLGRDYAGYEESTFGIDSNMYWEIFPTQTPTVEYAPVNNKDDVNDLASTFKDVNISSDENGTFLEVDYNEKDLIFGKRIYYNTTVTNTRKKTTVNRSISFALCPTTSSYVRTIELNGETSDGTKVSVFADTTQIPLNCTLKLVEDSEQFNDKLNLDIFSEKKWFTVQINDENGEVINPSGKPNICISLPDDYNDDDYMLFVYVENGSQAKRESQVGRTDIVDLENKIWTRKGLDAVSRYTYAICKLNKEIITDVESISDGIYSVNANFFKNGSIGTVSMSNDCLNHKAFLVKNGENTTFYFKSNSLDGDEAETGFYIGEVHLGDINLWENTTYTSFLADADGKLVNNATYNAYTEYADVLGGIIEMDNLCWNSEELIYRMTVQSPVMSAMSNLAYEEVKNSELSVWLQFSNSKLLTSNVTKENIERYIIAEGYGFNKSALERVKGVAETFLAEEDDYMPKTISNLKSVLELAKTVYDNEYSSAISASNAYGEQIKAIETAIDALVLDESAIGDKTELAALVEKAKEMKADEYTNSSFAALTEAITSAESALAKENVKQTKLDEQVEALQAAIDALEKKPENVLDKDNLADGKYTLYADMIKIDRISKSMSNNAINHTVQLEVKDGEYYITTQFKGMAIFNQFGYLRNLSYYDAGYTYNNYGAPQGTVIPAEVLSTYDVVDQYNDADNLYPELLRFKLVDKAREEFVPLQVFVPIMEAIAEGTGTQDVLMQLDWSTLAKATDATDDNNDDNNNNNQNNDNGQTDDNNGNKKVVNGKNYTVAGHIYKVTKVADDKKAGTVTFVKSANKKNVVIPKNVTLADGKTYNVTKIGAKAFTAKKIRKVTIGANVSKIAKKAFAKSAAKTLVVKTKKLKKASVKKALKKSKIKTVKVKIGSKKNNKKYVKKYKKIFTKKNVGKTVTVK